MKILVTGCAGFVGSHLTEKLLLQGHTVTGIDNFDPFYSRTIKEKNLASALESDQFSFIEGDICSISDLKKIPSDIKLVVHLAAKAGVRPSINNPEAYIQNNILGTQNLLSWMQINSIKKLVFASSSSVYGNNANVPFSEADAVDNPISPYAFSKKACELLNHTYHHLYNFDILNLRFFTVYGPRQRPDLAIRKFVELISKQESIPVYGDGNTGRDYTFVDDIVDGIISSIYFVNNNENVFEIINLGNNSPVILNELISHIGNALGIEPNVNYTEMQAGDVNLTYADISRAKKILNYSPQTTITEGLQKFVNWYRANENNSGKANIKLADRRIIAFSKLVDSQVRNTLSDPS